MADRSERTPAMERAADDVRRRGVTPYVIPIGASTPLGACAFVPELLVLPSTPGPVPHL